MRRSTLDARVRGPLTLAATLAALVGAACGSGDSPAGDSAAAAAAPSIRPGAGSTFTRGGTLFDSVLANGGGPVGIAPPDGGDGTRPPAAAAPKPDSGRPRP